MYIDTKYRGQVYEPLNPLNRPLFETLKRHQASMDGSSFYDDLIDIYINYELDYKEVAPVGKLPREIENPMVIDSLWNDEPKEPPIVGECAGCLEDIYAGQDIYECEGELVHQDKDCCMDYVANRSRCLVAGE